MTIRIIKEPEIVLTESAHEQLRRQWEAEQRYTAAPQSFETWLRQRGGQAGELPFDAGFLVSNSHGGSE